MPSNAKQCQAMPCKAMPSNAKQCHAMSSNVYTYDITVKKLKEIGGFQSCLRRLRPAAKNSFNNTSVSAKILYLKNCFNDTTKFAEILYLKNCFYDTSKSAHLYIVRPVSM